MCRVRSPCSPPRAPGRRRAGNKDRLPDIGRALRREGILPSLAPSGALAALAKERRLAAPGKAECLPSRRAHFQGASTRCAICSMRVCSPPRVPGRRRAGNKGRLPDIGRALRREGILPSLAPSGALAAFAKERRLAAPGKAECLPSRRRPFPRRINALRDLFHASLQPAEDVGSPTRREQGQAP